MFSEAFGAIAALQKKSLAGADLGQRFFQLARFSGENQRRKTGDLRFHVGQRRRLRINGNLHDRLGSPAFGRPTFHHTQHSKGGAGPRQDREAPVYTPARPKRQTPR